MDNNEWVLEYEKFRFELSYHCKKLTHDAALIDQFADRLKMFFIAAQDLERRSVDLRAKSLLISLEKQT